MPATAEEQDVLSPLRGERSPIPEPYGSSAPLSPGSDASITTVLEANMPTLDSISAASGKSNFLRPGTWVQATRESSRDAFKVGDFGIVKSSNFKKTTVRWSSGQKSGMINWREYCTLVTGPQTDKPATPASVHLDNPRDIVSPVAPAELAGPAQSNLMGTLENINHMIQNITTRYRKETTTQRMLDELTKQSSQLTEAQRRMKLNQEHLKERNDILNLKEEEIQTQRAHLEQELGRVHNLSKEYESCKAELDNQKQALDSKEQELEKERDALMLEVTNGKISAKNIMQLFDLNKKIAGTEPGNMNCMMAMTMGILLATQVNGMQGGGLNRHGQGALVSGEWDRWKEELLQRAIEAETRLKLESEMRKHAEAKLKRAVEMIQQPIMTKPLEVNPRVPELLVELTGPGGDVFRFHGMDQIRVPTMALDGDYKLRIVHLSNPEVPFREQRVYKRGRDWEPRQLQIPTASVDLTLLDGDAPARGSLVQWLASLRGRWYHFQNMQISDSGSRTFYFPIYIDSVKYIITDPSGRRRESGDMDVRQKKNIAIQEVVNATQALYLPNTIEKGEAIVVLADNSGSMDTHIELLRRGMSEILEQAERKIIRMAIATWNDSTEWRIKELEHPDRMKRKRHQENWIDDLSADGGTELEQALVQTMTQFPTTNHVLVMTDGQLGGTGIYDHNSFSTFRKRYLRTKFHFAAFGGGASKEKLQAMASCGDGQFLDVSPVDQNV